VQSRRKLVRADECIYAEVSGNQDEQYSLPDILTHNSGLSITFECTEELFEAFLPLGISNGSYYRLQEVSGVLGPVNVVEQYDSSISGNLSRFCRDTVMSKRDFYIFCLRFCRTHFLFSILAISMCLYMCLQTAQ
jgi:hypothetical protein